MAVTSMARQSTTGGLARNGGPLVANVVVSGALGFAFWVAAARSSEPAAVGRASAVITSVMALAGLCQQSLVLTLPGLLSGAADPRRLASRAYAVAGAATAVVAAGYVLIAPRVASGLEFLSRPGDAGIVVAACMVWATFSLQDAVLTGARRGAVVLAENTTWGLARLGGVIALGIVAAPGHRSLLLAWIVPAIPLVLAVSWYLFWSRSSPIAVALGSRRHDRRTVARLVVPEQLAAVAGAVPNLLLPAVALTALGAETSAPFLAAWAYILVVETAMGSFCQAYVVEVVSGDPSGAGAVTRRAVVVLAGIVGAALVGAVAFGEEAMGILGPEYRLQATVLTVHVVGLFGRSAWLFANASNRARGDGTSNLVLQLGYTALFVASIPFIGSSPVQLAWILVGCRTAVGLLAVARLRRYPADRP